MIDSRDRRFLGMCAAELGLGALAFVIGWAIGVDPRAYVPLWWDWAGIGFGLIVGSVFGLFLAMGMLMLGLLPIPAIQSLSEKAEQQLRVLLYGLSIPQLITLALTAGVGEELLFRGLVLQSITGDIATCTFMTAALGIGISSLVFGLAHPMSVTYVVFAVIMGLAMGVMYWYFRSLLVPLVAHWVYDAVMMVWLVKRANSVIN